MTGLRSFGTSFKRTKHLKNSFRHSWYQFRCFGQPAAVTHPHLIAEGEVTPGITKQEYYNRRYNLVKNALSLYNKVNSVKSHLFIFPSATTVYMTKNIPYPFRQNTDFLYFCGFQEPDSFLIVESDNETAEKHKSILFVPNKDPSKELWDGPRSGVDGALQLTGVDSAYVSNDLEKYLEDYNSRNKDYILWYDHTNFRNRESCSRVTSQLSTDSRHKSIETPKNVAHKLQVIKSPSEVELMFKSNSVASDAFVEVMKYSKPQINEAHLWAKMDFECRIRGAEFLAYPPVVAGGARANTIHYITNNQMVDDGDLVLMDAGCELHGYASDITRTWPVSGVFSEAQRDLYSACLRVQEACIERCTTAMSLDELYMFMLDSLATELTKLGIIPNNCSQHERIQLARKFCPHHVSHYLGMDIHDTSSVSRQVKLEPNMVVTVEPGIYIPRNEFSTPEKYRGIGVRIEDNILITKLQPVNLSASCPKKIEDIESLMSC